MVYGSLIFTALVLAFLAYRFLMPRLAATVGGARAMSDKAREQARLEHLTPPQARRASWGQAYLTEDVAGVARGDLVSDFDGEEVVLAEVGDEFLVLGSDNTVLLRSPLQGLAIGIPEGYDGMDAEEAYFYFLLSEGLALAVRRQEPLLSPGSGTLEFAYWDGLVT